MRKKNTGAALALAVVCGGLLIGCGGKPMGLSQEVYDLGVETCDVLEDYVEGRMNQNTCLKKLTVLEAQAKVMDDEFEEEYGDEYPTQIHTDNADVLFQISFISSAVSLVDDGETYEAQDELEELKDKLNLE